MIRKTRDLILRFLVLFVHIFEAILIASADGGFLWKLFNWIRPGFILFGAVQLSESLPVLSSAYSDCALRICWRLLKSYFLPGLKNRFGCCCSFCFLSLLVISFLTTLFSMSIQDMNISQSMLIGYFTYITANRRATGLSYSRRTQTNENTSFYR